MNIVFVGDNLRNAVFCRIADHLIASGHEVFWIATGSHGMRNTLAPYSNVVDISGAAEVDNTALSAIEEHSEMTIRGIIASDRILSTKSELFALGYISNVFSKVFNLINDNNIDIVFGEATWAHGLVAASVCRMLGAKYLVPATVRYTSERFAFFDGVTQEHIVNTSNIPDIAAGRELLNRFHNGSNRPFYMDKPVRNLRHSVFHHIKRYLVGDVNDMTVPPFLTLVKDKLKSIKPISTQPTPERYIYLPLHVQPESSLDVLGEFYNNQYEFVKNVAKCLPYGVKLAVKEHPKRKNRVDVSDIAGVVMVRGDSLELIRSAEAVVSVSGTACFEAGLLGVPAYTFSKMFFNDLPTVKYCNTFEELKLSFKNKPEANESGVIGFLAGLYADSYNGYCESPVVYADALGEENISNLIYAFEDILRYSSPKSSTIEASICSSPT